MRYQECELPDDYPVHPLYNYVLYTNVEHGVVIQSLLTGNIADLKWEFSRQGRTPIKITSCDIHGRQEAAAAGREYVPDSGEPVPTRVQPCGECGSTTNPIVSQCYKCGCAVCSACPDHEKKC